MKQAFQITIYLIFLLFSSCAVCQCELTITNVSMDTLEESITRTFNDACITYKTKGKHKLNIYVDGKLGETQNILSVFENDEYTKIEVLNKYKVVVMYHFFKETTKLETFIATNGTHILETGSGLSYRISKRIRGKTKIIF